MKIEFTLDPEQGIDLTTVVGGELSWYNPETEEEEYRPKTLGDLLAEKLADKAFARMSIESVTGLASALRDERISMIRERTAPMLEQALAEPIILTNQYGESRGRSVTIRELIVDEAVKQLNTKIDRHSSSNETLLRKVIREEVTRAMTAELNEALAEAKGTLISAVKEKAAEFLTEATLAKKLR